MATDVPDAGGANVDTTRRTWTSHSGRGFGVMARLLSAAAAMVVVGWLLYLAWTAVDVYARHLCRWPARISCDDGAGIWWLVPWSLGALAGIAAWGLVDWARSLGSHRTAWLMVLWLMGFGPVVVTMGPRQFGLADLWVDTTYLAIGVLLASVVVTAAAPRRRRLVVGATFVALAVLGLLALAMPSVLSATWERRF